MLFKYDLSFILALAANITELWKQFAKRIFTAIYKASLKSVLKQRQFLSHVDQGEHSD